MGTNQLAFRDLIGIADPRYPAKVNLSLGSHKVAPGVSHYLGLVAVTDLPSGIPNTPNLRSPKLNSPVSKDVRNSLTLNDGNFHLKNRGITLLASSIERDDDGSFTASLGGDDGILDGGHTYAIIQDVIKAGVPLDRQFVFVAIRVNVPEVLHGLIAEGLNKSTAVSAGSLANRLGEFDWLKHLIGAAADRVAWRQNDVGVVKVEDLVAQLYATNTHQQCFDRRWLAYASRAKVLAAYRANPGNFRDHAPAACDTLHLYEHISYNFVGPVTEALGSRAIERATKLKPFQPVFLPDGARRSERLTRAVALPLLGGIALFVKPTGNHFVFDRPVEELISLLEKNASRIIATLTTLWNRDGVNGDPGAFGKTADTWKGIQDLFIRLATENPTTYALPVIMDADFPATDEDPAVSVEDLLAQWRDELSELQRSLDVLREASNDSATTSESMADTIAQTRIELAGLELAIAALESGTFGSCSGCGKMVETERLSDVATCLVCGSCDKTYR